MIHSFELEKKVLSGLLQHQHKWEEIATIINEKDFYSEDSKVHISIFKLIRSSLNKGEAIDDTILIEKLNALNVSFPDNIEISEFIHSLAYFKISEEVFISCVKELKKVTACRTIYNSCSKTAKFVKKADPTLSYQEIIDSADKLYNEDLKNFECGDAGPVDLFEIMEDLIEERGNNPQESFGLLGPHKRMNEIYGPILRAGNIAVIVARSGQGKTSYALDYCTRTGAANNVPVVHFDNGEMSEEELVMRQCSAMSGIPMWLLETGKWRNTTYNDLSAEEVVERVRNTFKKIKEGNGMKLYYINVAGMDADEMCSQLKRIYYSKIGRGNQMIFSFDYIKTDFANMGKNDGWAQVAYLVHKFKQTIHRDLCFDGKPCVSMLTSVQSNRLGITTNRGVENIVDDESVVSLSDAITHFCSWLFLLRQKVVDEIADEGEDFGTHKLINLKARHLGRDALRHINPVSMPDGSKKRNFINLRIKNFSVEECGDLQDIANFRNGIAIEPNSTTPEEDTELPDILRRDEQS